MCTFYSIISTITNIFKNQTDPQTHIWYKHTYIYKHTFAFVSNFSAMVGVQEILSTVSPPNGIIPSDGMILIVDKRLWSQICNWKFVDVLNYPFKLLFQSFHRKASKLLPRERISRHSGWDDFGIEFQRSGTHIIWTSIRICTHNPADKLFSGTLQFK